jgi:hypothetical protein
MKLLALAGSTVVNCGLVVAMSSFYNPPDIVRVGGLEAGSLFEYDRLTGSFELPEICTLTDLDLRKIGYNSIRYVHPSVEENYFQCSIRSAKGANVIVWVLPSRLKRIYGSPSKIELRIIDLAEWPQFIM